MTTNIMNSELVTRTGPTVKSVSGAIAMWISIPGRYSSFLSNSRAERASHPAHARIAPRVAWA